MKTIFSFVLEFFTFLAARWKLMLPSVLGWNTDLQNFLLEDMVDIFKIMLAF